METPDPQTDPAIYEERSYVDDRNRRVTVRTPVDTVSPPRYTGHAVAMFAPAPGFAPQPVPFEFPIEAGDVKEAYVKFEVCKNDYLPKLQQELNERMMRNRMQEKQRIILPK